MGRASDEGAVVDAKFRVRSVPNYSISHEFMVQAGHGIVEKL